MDTPSSIGHYRILAKIGEGGMGAVYRATDTKLNREVAIKVLPPEFAADTGRMQRFEREAQMLAALNHPNIAAIYGIEAGAIVMELVEGEDLKGPVPAEVAVGYARQMIDALEAAHEKGIVHRDLKPANVRVTGYGVVKLLDFGLAKAPEASATAVGASPTISPTLSIGMTQAGMILGTAAYMSPEQARGKTIDHRADIWAFGVVLYELLTGSALYGGETVTDTLAAVVLKEPDYAKLPAGTPAGLRRLIRSCLQKDPRARLRDIGDARLLLDEVETPATVAAAKRPWLPWAVAAAVAVAGAVAVAARKPTVAPSMTVRFPLQLPEGTIDARLGRAAPQTAPSPDGKRLAFIAESDGKPTIWIRAMDSPVAHRLDRTEGASIPFWSPDSQYIGYFEEGKLKKIPAAGGAPQTLADFVRGSTRRLNGDGGTWRPDGTILFATGVGPLMRTTASGGSSAPATTLDESQQEYKHTWPQFLPDGKHLLYFAASYDWRKSGIYVQELGSSKRTLLRRSTTRAVWAPPEFLMFLNDGTLLAQRVNFETGSPLGEPSVVAEEVSSNLENGRTSVAVSPSGVLTYRAGVDSNEQSRLTWMDRDGKPLGSIGAAGRYRSVRLSPDEKSASLLVASDEGVNVAMMDLTTGVLTSLTTDGRNATVLGPWSPDSQRIAVNPAERTGVLEIAVSSGQKRMIRAADVYANDWTPDGQFVLATLRSGIGLSLLPVAGGAAKPVSEAPYRRIAFHFSPDGRFVSYTSNESGISQAAVASFPSFDEKRQISLEGGTSTSWRKDGREVFFLSGTDLMSVDIRTEPRIESGTPRRLFRTNALAYAASGDGKRFLLIQPPNRIPTPETMVVVNWAAGLKEQ